jgi:hypothetical protein
MGNFPIVVNENFLMSGFDQIDFIGATFGDRIDSLAASHVSVHGLPLRGPISLWRAERVLRLNVPSLRKGICP